MRKQNAVLWVCITVLLAVIFGSMLFTAPVPSAAVSLAPTPSDPNLVCVNGTGTGCTFLCGGCYDAVQTAVDAVPSGGTVRVAAGTYTGHAVAHNNVVLIDKSLSLQGSFDATCSTSGAGETILDGAGTRTVIKVTSGETNPVSLSQLTLKNGNGIGNCGVTYEGCGGGLYVDQTPITVSGVIFRDNVGCKLGSGAGGGAYVNNLDASAAAHFDSCQFITNIASDQSIGFGGALLIDAGLSPAQTIVENNVFTGNSGSTKYEGYGGAVYITERVDLHDNVFTNNFAAADQGLYGSGGAVYLWKAVDVALWNNEFVQNSTIEIPGQFSVGRGGAFFASTGITMTVYNNLFVRNSALSAGSAIYMESTGLPVNAEFWHNTILHNQESGSVAAIVLGDNSGATNAGFINNIIAGNAQGFDNQNAALNELRLDTNCLWNAVDTETGTAPMLQDPQLSPAYYPRTGSPVIEAGLPVGQAFLGMDKDGLTRPQGTAPNLGAYESTRQVTMLPVVLRTAP
ncbi:MAG: choice-of-anchor Q domain-containing protein [Anaerolineae bacterium]|nr:choice-of-anchor Q domain-containing protein [Anaerolineae bacterium]